MCVCVCVCVCVSLCVCVCVCEFGAGVISPSCVCTLTRSIADLQTRNEELLAVVRGLSQQNEKMESELASEGYVCTCVGVMMSH